MEHRPYEILYEGVPDNRGAAREWWLKENTTNFPEGEQMLRETIDFTVIKDLLVGEYRKLGLPETDVRDVPIFFTDDDESVGVYDPYSDYILLNRDRFKALLEQRKNNPNSLETQTEWRYLLKTIIHERVHSISGVLVGINQEVQSSMVGFGIWVFDKVQKTVINDRFRAVDEGATELWAQELTAEYLRREGFSDAAELTAIELGHIEHGENHRNWAYTKEVRFVRKFIKKIAKHTGVSDEVVWAAFKRAKVLNREYEFETFLNQLKADPEIGPKFADGLFTNLENDILVA